MTRLTIYADTEPGDPIADATEGPEIVKHLGDVGVKFERWQADKALGEDADQDSILATYRAEIDRLFKEGGYKTADVIRLKPDHPDRVALRNKFLDEHTHGEDEVRFFVEGSGAFYLHLAHKVYRIVCEKNDLLSVPAGTRHWFDMGPTPRLTCIRIFNNPEGWVAQFTGDKIAGKFPKYGE
jgi:1,2-dihydroxy-3-keto-5-methylthiopentene dioxygenase